jgi:hypothetical protein
MEEGNKKLAGFSAVTLDSPIAEKEESITTATHDEDKVTEDKGNDDSDSVCFSILIRLIS